MGIAVTALLSPWALASLQDVYRGIAISVDPQHAGWIAGTARTLLAFVVLLVPTVLMGASLPLAVRAVRRTSEVRGDSRAMGLLYAFNTTGAIIGTLAAGFLLIGSFGMTIAITLAALANMLAGLSGLLLDRFPLPPTHEASKTPRPRRQGDE